jgi:hypothetical protein
MLSSERDWIIYVSPARSRKILISSFVQWRIIDLKVIVPKALETEKVGLSMFNLHENNIFKFNINLIQFSSLFILDLLGMSDRYSSNLQLIREPQLLVIPCINRFIAHGLSSKIIFCVSAFISIKETPGSLVYFHYFIDNYLVIVFV